MTRRPPEELVEERADELLPEERAGGSDNPEAQAEAILEESEERTLDPEPVERRTSARHRRPDASSKPLARVAHWAGNQPGPEMVEPGTSARSEEVSMFPRRDKTQMPTADEALPGRPSSAFAVPARHFVLDAPLEPPFPEGFSRRCSAWAASGARERKFWETPGVYTTAVGYAGGFTPEPHLRRGVQRPHRSQRGRARRVRSRAGELRDAAARVLGEPRPDAGHASGQRRRHAVPLGHLHVRRRAARGGRSSHARCSRSGCSDAGYGEITTEIVDAPTFFYAEDYHQQYLAKNPMGYCGLGGTGVSCPIGGPRRVAGH